MKRSALFIISSDPLTSHRPAEAVRIAAGIHAWEQVSVRLYLHQPVIRALVDATKVLRDEELFRHYLPMLASSAQPICVPPGLSPSLNRDLAPIPFLEIPERELATLAAQSTWVLRF